MEYLSSIVFHTGILNKLSKEAKSRNVASLGADHLIFWGGGLGYFPKKTPVSGFERKK